MYEGIVVFMEGNKGSKSEGLYPYLYVGDGKYFRIRVATDDSFDNISLRDYDGKRVIVDGNFNDNGVYYVDTIIKKFVYKKTYTIKRISKNK